MIHLPAVFIFFFLFISNFDTIRYIRLSYPNLDNEWSTELQQITLDYAGADFLRWAVMCDSACFSLGYAA